MPAVLTSATLNVTEGQTVKLLEETTFYLLPKKRFLEICGEYESFTEFFTDIFGKRMLRACLDNDLVDFGHDVLPEAVRTGRVQAHCFSGYWRDIGTLDAYYEANLDLGLLLIDMKQVEEAAEQELQREAPELARAGRLLVEGLVLLSRLRLPLRRL